MNNKTYFLPIDSNNLGEYFSRALIVPQKYIDEPFQDFQSLNIESLILTNKKFTINSDCSIEVVLIPEEINSNKDKDYMLLGTALPITRVVGIYFYSKEKMARTIDLARSSSFIPERLLKLTTKNDDDFFDESVINFKSGKAKNDISDKIDKYNRYLGGFAFMRLGGENYMNYSKNYFSTLEFFNSSIKKDVDKVRSELKLENTFQGLFDINNSYWNEWRNIIFGDFQSIISKLEGTVPAKNNLFQQNSVRNNKKLYILSILANYGPEQFKSKDTDSLVMAIISDEIEDEYKEAIALFYGVHNGYRAFSKNYYLNNEVQTVKYELESKLDCYTLESIYKFIFSSSKSSELNYIENIIPSKTKHVDKRNYLTYKIIDENIIYREKPIAGIIDRFIKSTRLNKILDALSFNFSKKSDIKLTIEQKNKIENNYLSIIEEPFYRYLQDLEEELTEFHEKKMSELERRNSEFREEQNRLSLLLKKADETLFDEIDTNRDGKLSQIEIGVFMDKIIKAKKQLESNNFIGERYKSSATNLDRTMSVREKAVKYSENNIIIIHNYYLPKLSFTELKKVAKTQNISVPAKLSSKDKDGIKLLIEQIINAIESSDKFL